MHRRISLAEAAGAAAFFLGATIILTWPVAIHFNDGLADLWDAKFCGWVLHWDYHQLFRDPLHLFDANIFYPARDTLAFSENLLGVAVFGFPLLAAGLSTLAVYNLIFLLGMFLSALAAWALARRVTGNGVASLFAGLVYAFLPWRISQIPHLQFQWGAFLPLTLLFLLEYLEGGRRRDQVLFGVFLAWNAASNVHYAIFSVFLVGAVALYEALVRPRPETNSRIRGALAASAAAALLVLPLFAPYASASRLYDMERADGEIAFFSGRLTDFLSAGWQNKLYGGATQKWEHPEGDFFPGLVPLILAAVALARARRAPFGVKSVVPRARIRFARALDVLLVAGILVWTSAAFFSIRAIGPIQLGDPGRVVVWLTLLTTLRLILAFPARSSYSDLRDFLRRTRLEPPAALFLLVGVIGVVVALGWHTPFYRFLVESGGSVFRGIRVPARGIVLFDLALGVLASWGLASLRRSKLAAAVAILLTAFEYRAFPIRVTPVEGEPPPVDRWLAGVPLTGPVVEWPLGIGADEVEYQFRSTAHWKTLVNGYSGYYPPPYQELAALLDKRSLLEKRAISPELWSILERRDCHLLVLHPHMIEDEPVRHIYLAALRERMEQGRLRPVGRFVHGLGDDLVFEFQKSGRASGAVASSGSPSPPTKKELDILTEALNPPFGYIDSPIEEEVVLAGAGGYGWALDDSGVDSVLVSFDGGPDVPVRYGQPHPGPARVYPGYPDARSAGFQFTIPRLSPGWHVLAVTIVARDRGRERLLRRFQTR
jgi:hypothetical protein